MNIHRQRTGIALLCILVMGLSAATKSAAQDPGTSRADKQVLQLQLKSAKAKSIARERYQALKQFDFPLWHGFGEFSYAFFPSGRADRVYIFSNPDIFHNPDTDRAELMCYQRQGHQEKLVYVIHLQNRERTVTKLSPVKSVAHPQSLLEFVTLEQSWHDSASDNLAQSYQIKGKMSRFAAADLAAPRDYVHYTYSDEGGGLSVDMLSDLGNVDPSYHDNGVSQMYLLYPGVSKFYKKYGLPLAKKELLQLSTEH